MIELSTANNKTDPSDYWDSNLYKTEKYTNDITDKEMTAYISHKSVEELIDTASTNRFVLYDNPQTIYDYTDAEFKIKVYDGYNE